MRQSRWTTHLALVLSVLLPTPAMPQSSARVAPSSRLFATPFAVFEANRVSIGLDNDGQIGQDLATFQGPGHGIWPRGSENRYISFTGLQLAGLIRGSKPANPWGGDTAGALFYDQTQVRKHGIGLTPIYRSTNPQDLANWPDLALVPTGDASAAFYDASLQGRRSASDGDAYWITWDGVPASTPSRAHPLGVLVEHRVLAWNYPSGNADMLYVVATYYNITSLRASDYAQHRPAMRTLLTQTAQEFHALNNATYGITLPEAGYAIDELHAGWGADPDVGQSGFNYSSVNLPFSLGFAWHARFPTLATWRYDPELFGSPFLPGVGLVGTAFLGTPTGEGDIHLYSTACGGAPLGCPLVPTNASRLWRTLSGRFDLFAYNDAICGIPGDPRINRVCFVRNGPPGDVGYYQSARAHTLLPGASATVVVALVHAAPVAIPGFVPTAATDVKPLNPLWIASVDSMVKYGGVNRIDSIAGFRGFTDNGDGVPQPREFDLVPRSLLAKTRLARQIFENKFLLPSAPAAPAFTVTPGNARVTITWQPSTTEQSGDPYFTAAATPTRTGAGAGEPNAMYDPNFRRLDVEGYRLYRGQTDDPAALELVAQWDYAGTSFNDFGGNVVLGGLLPQTPDCAPELGRGTPPQCRVAFTPITPGVASTASFSYALNGLLVQVDYGGRDLLAGGGVLLLPGQVDTALTSRGLPLLRDSGVPFTYVDQDVRNGVRYFYTVTAFDINSIRSGPSSMESPKVLQAVTVGGPTGPISDDPLERVHTVPDPYYASAGAPASQSREIAFVNVPAGARIRIYSMNTTLIRVLDAPAGSSDATLTWNLRNRANALVASGVYFYHVESGGRSRVGRMTIAH